MFAFAAAKLLSFLPFGNFLRGAGLKILIAVVVIGAIAFFIWRHNEKIRQEAYEAIFKEQVENQLAQQQKEFDNLLKVLEERDKAIKELLKDRQEVMEFYQRIVGEVRRGNLEDGQVAPVLRFVIEEIRQMEGGAEALGETTEDGAEGNSAILQWLESEEEHPE